MSNCEKTFPANRPRLDACGSILLIAIVLLAGLWPQSNHAATVKLVRDINRESRSFSGDSPLANDRYVYVLRRYEVGKSELWVTDGNRSRQHRLDESIGTVSTIIGLTRGFVYIEAQNADGTAIYQLPAGQVDGDAVQLIKLKRPRYVPYGTYSLQTKAGALYLRLARSENRFDLMRVDESAGSLKKVTGLNSGQLQVVGNQLFVLVPDRDRLLTRLLVISDGADRPRFVARMPLASEQFYPQVGPFRQKSDDTGAFYFQIADRFDANNSPVCALWRSDGTRSGTYPMVQTGTFPNARAPVCPRIVGQTKKAVYFERENKQKEQLELWFSDDAATTIRPVEHKDDLNEVVVTESTLWFTTKRNEGRPWTLWRKDGLESAANPYLQSDRAPISFLSAVAGGITYVAGRSNLYYTSRALQSSVKIGRYPSIEAPISAIGSKIVFNASRVGSRSGTDWLVFDWRSKKHKTLSRFNTISEGSQTGDRILTRNDAAWVCSKVRSESGGGSQVEIWRSDGSRKGTMPVVAKPGNLTDCGAMAIDENYLYFVKHDPQHGAELWRSGHRGENKELLADLLPGARSSSPRDLSVINNRLLMSAKTQYQGQARYRAVVWTYDGNWSVLNPQLDSPSIVATSSQRALLTASSGSKKTLWVTDGTPARTKKLADDVRKIIRVDEHEETFYIQIRSRGANGVYTLSPDATSLTRVAVQAAGIPGGAQLLRYHRGSLFFREISRNAVDYYNYDRVLRYDIAAGTVETVFQRANTHVTDAKEMTGQLFFKVYDVEPRSPQPLGWRALRYTLEDGVAEEFRMRLTHRDRFSLPFQPPQTKMYGDGSRLWFFAPTNKAGVELWQISP